MTDLAEPMLETHPLGPTEPAGGPPPLEPAPQAHNIRLKFTGTGGEYFRIWIVNLLLTIVTVGIYSAWAKVRKTRYFWINTQLDGAVFQYHGDPMAILRGRILVGVIFVGYSLIGRISIQAGIVAAVVLGLLAPWFFYKAMRFKLSNTTWRGIRFGFDSTVGAAYGALAPAVILWVLLSGVSADLATLRPGDKPNPVPMLLVYGLFLALVPLLHARIKRYQHGATTCGSHKFDFEPSTGAFYGLYGKTFLVALVPFVLASIAVAVSVMAMGKPAPESKASFVAIMIVSYVVFVLAYLLPGSYFSARLQRLVWARTHGGPIRFSTSVGMRGLMRTWFKNGLLTLLTLGLYWPYAAVNIARYQIECMTVEAAASLGSLAAGTQAIEPSAAGDGAVDFVGWDIGL
jgi:uncharacterized membrane protein YjgN (DUF898 family)